MEPEHLLPTLLGRNRIVPAAHGVRVDVPRSVQHNNRPAAVPELLEPCVHFLKSLRPRRDLNKKPFLAFNGVQRITDTVHHHVVLEPYGRHPRSVAPATGHPPYVPSHSVCQAYVGLLQDAAGYLAPVFVVFVVIFITVVVSPVVAIPSVRIVGLKGRMWR